MITSNYQVDGDIYSYADKFICDSRDDKPSNADAPGGLINGATLEETDTGKTYIFDKKANKWTEKSAGGGGGGGGSTTLAGLTDVDISNPSNGQTLVYNATSGKWENGAGGGGGLVVLQGVANADSTGIQLATTYAELYTMMQNGVVVVTCPNFEDMDIFFAYLGAAASDEGAYIIVGNTITGRIDAHGTASDTVLFTLPY